MTDKERIEQLTAERDEAKARAEKAEAMAVKMRKYISKLHAEYECWHANEGSFYPDKLLSMIEPESNFSDAGRDLLEEVKRLRERNAAIDQQLPGLLGALGVGNILDGTREVQRLREIVGKLPQTRDMVHVIPVVDQVWAIHDDRLDCCAVLYWEPHNGWLALCVRTDTNRVIPVGDCYSTLEAALAAKEAK